MTPYPQKITFGEMRASGVRDVLIYCRDYCCGHHTEASVDARSCSITPAPWASPRQELKTRRPWRESAGVWTVDRDRGFRRSTVAWVPPARTGVTNLWHDHCIVQDNWDFSTQLENKRCRDAYFEPGDASLPFPCATATAHIVSTAGYLAHGIRHGNSTFAPRRSRRRSFQSVIHSSAAAICSGSCRARSLARFPRRA
jgi:hypothetical protein